MTFNKKKFNIIMIFTILLICLVVVFSTFDFSSAIINGTDAEENTDGGIVIDDENGKSGDIETPVIHTEKMQEWEPTKVTAYSAYIQALSTLRKYENKMTWTQRTTGEIDNIGIGVRFSIDREIYNVKQKSYVKNAFAVDVDAPANALNKNGCSYNCIDYDAEIINDESFQEYTGRHGFLISEIPYIINPKTAVMTLKNDPNLDYFTINVTLKSSSAWGNWEKAFEKEIGGDVAFTEIKLTILIDKTYGAFKKVSISEKFNLAMSYAGISVSGSGTNVITYQFSYASYPTQVAQIREKSGLDKAD